MLRYYNDYDNGEIVMNSFYPCIKYKFQADPALDGTDYFIIAESMNWNGMKLALKGLTCSLSFTCEDDQKAFYKLIKDCLQFRIHEESFCDFLKQCKFSTRDTGHYK